MKILARQLTPTAGSVAYAGRDLKQYDGRDFARSVAYLPQDLSTGSDMTIRELVACGRYPWHGALGRFSDLDRQKVEAAIEATHIERFADRMVGTLSGGGAPAGMDRHADRTGRKTACCSTSRLLHSISPIRSKSCRWCGGLRMRGGRSIVIVLHDINMAARFCDRIHALNGGRVVASGTPDGILVPETLRSIYGIDMGCDCRIQPEPSLAYAR